MRRGLATAALLCSLAAGCRFSGAVEVSPVSGPPPATVAIWPLAEGGEPPDADLWFAGLAYQLGRRGYRVVAPGVTREVLLASDLATAAADLPAVGRALDADALLVVELHAFEARGRDVLRAASWDVSWSLVSTRGLGRQWAHAAHGSWRQADRAPLDSPRGFDEFEDPGPLVSIGGSAVPSFRDVEELVAHLHRAAMQRLPELEAGPARDAR